MPASQYSQITSRDVIGMMFQAMEDAGRKSWLPQVANEFTSDQASETYAGIGTVPQMREWLGGKHAKSFTNQSLTISNKDWESTIEIKVKDLRRDKTGFLQARIAELMTRAMGHQSKLVSDLIESGTGTTLGACYDGKALWADNHSVGDSGTIDNSISVDISALPVSVNGSTTAPSVPEFIYSVFQGVKTIMSFKDDQGEPINEMANSFLIMVPTGLSDVAHIAETQQSINNEDNPMLRSRFNFTVAHNPRLTWTDKFAVFRADAPFKAFISQIEAGEQFKALAEGSDYEFSNNAHLYSVEKCGNVGYGRFDQTCLVTLA